MAGYNYNRYGDNLARKQRRRFFLKFLLIICSILGLAASVIYLFFFSSLMQIEEVSIEGLRNIKSEDIFPIIDSIISQSIFDPISIKPQKNIVFFDEEIVKSKISSQFPSIKEVNISKDYPHKLTVFITEREAIGTWCLNFSQECRYFDNDGIFWGKAFKSSGALLLSVEDSSAYENEPKKAPEIFLESIKKSLAGLEDINIKPTNIIIPEGSLEDFHVHTVNDYYILFDAGSEITKQLEVLEIFMDNQNSNFKPEYIDLRIEGRIYYK